MITKSKCEMKTYLIEVKANVPKRQIDRGREFGSDYAESDAHPHTIPTKKQGPKIESGVTHHQKSQKPKRDTRLHTRKSGGKGRIQGRRENRTREPESDYSEAYSQTIPKKKTKQHAHQKRKGSGGKGKKDRGSRFHFKSFEKNQNVPEEQGEDYQSETYEETGCRDVPDYKANCPQWKVKHGCSNVRKPGWSDSISSLCPKTCGLCPGTLCLGNYMSHCNVKKIIKS